MSYKTKVSKSAFSDEHAGDNYAKIGKRDSMSHTSPINAFNKAIKNYKSAIKRTSDLKKIERLSGKINSIETTLGKVKNFYSGPGAFASRSYEDAGDIWLEKSISYNHGEKKLNEKALKQAVSSYNTALKALKNNSWERKKVQKKIDAVEGKLYGTSC